MFIIATQTDIYFLLLANMYRDKFEELKIYCFHMYILPNVVCMGVGIDEFMYISGMLYVCMYAK
jgi:hypothetical protein